MSQQVYSKELFKDEVLTPGGEAQSETIDVNSMHPLGQFASQLKVVGDGAVSVELYISINGTSYVLYDTLLEDYEEGEYVEGHSFAVAKKFYVKIKETSQNDSVTVSHWLGVQ